jgi:hypothetical protein
MLNSRYNIVVLRIRQVQKYRLSTYTPHILIPLESLHQIIFKSTSNEYTYKTLV